MRRRTFMAQTAAGALAPQVARAEAGRIRVGMLGTGHSHFAGKLKALGDTGSYDVAAVAEPNPELRKKAQADPRFASLRFVSEDDLLSDRTIQLVVVECRVWEAIPYGNKVVAAGKHLHLEKPPGNTYGEFRDLIEQARRKQLLVQTGYVWRFHEGVKAAIEAAQKGWLGEVFMVRGTINSDRGPDERAVEGRYKGGGMFELSGHVIDRMVELLGRPKAVRSWLRHDTSVPDKLADNNLAVFEYDKALAVVTQSTKMAGAGDYRSFEVIGSDGTFLVYPETNPPSMRVFMRMAHGQFKAGLQNIALAPQPRFTPDFADLARAITTHTPLKHSYEHELLLQETLLRASGEMA